MKRAARGDVRVGPSVVPFPYGQSMSVAARPLSCGGVPRRRGRGVDNAPVRCRGSRIGRHGMLEARQQASSGVHQGFDQWLQIGEKGNAWPGPDKGPQRGDGFDFWGAAVWAACQGVGSAQRPPKMSLFPNVAGHDAGTSGAGEGVAV